VVRCFEDPDVIHVAGKVDPVSDMETIEIELMLADIQHLDNLLPKAERAAKSADKDAKLKVEAMKKCLRTSASRNPCARSRSMRRRRRLSRNSACSTAKPILYVANVDETDLAGKGPLVQRVAREAAKKSGAEVVPGVREARGGDCRARRGRPGRDARRGGARRSRRLAALARAAYKTLGLQSYFTAGEGSAGLDDPRRRSGPAGGRRDPYRLRKGLHPRRNLLCSMISSTIERKKTSVPLRQAPASKGRTTSCADGDICHFLVNR